MENFVIVWTIDGETMSIPHPTQDQALTITRKTLDSRARTCAEMFTPRVEGPPAVVVTRSLPRPLTPHRRLILWPDAP
jgi:hypothetical protein